MGFATMKTQRKVTPYLVNLVVDTDADIANLPTHYAPGSKCTVIATSFVYMLNNAREWIRQLNTGGGGGSGDIFVEGSLATEADIDNLFQGSTLSEILSLATKEDIDNLFDGSTMMVLATKEDIDNLFN